MAVCTLSVPQSCQRTVVPAPPEVPIRVALVRALAAGALDAWVLVSHGVQRGVSEADRKKVFLNDAQLLPLIKCMIKGC